MRCLLLLCMLAWVSAMGAAQQLQERDEDVGGEGVVNEEAGGEGAVPVVNEEEEEQVLDPEWYVQGCRYYCIYGDEPYCCDEGSLPYPEDHNPHEGLTCPAEEDQICKSNGIYLLTRAARPDVRLLLKGTSKKQTPCASDGYCMPDMRCCPSPCGRRHICLPDPASVLLPEEKSDDEDEVVVVEGQVEVGRGYEGDEMEGEVVVGDEVEVIE